MLQRFYKIFVFVLFIFALVLTSNNIKAKADFLPTDSSATETTTKVITINRPSALEIRDLSTKTELKVQLSWKASADKDIDGYNVYRATGTETIFAKIGTSDSRTEKYLDTNVKNGVTYSYKVTAYKGSDESATTNVVEASISYATNSDKKPLSALSNLEGINNIPLNRALVFLALAVILISAILYLAKNKLTKVAPALYRPIVRTQIQTTAGKILAGILAIAVIVIFLIVYFMVTKDNLFIFIK